MGRCPTPCRWRCPRTPARELTPWTPRRCAANCVPLLFVYDFFYCCHELLLGFLVTLGKLTACRSRVSAAAEFPADFRRVDVFVRADGYLPAVLYLLHGNAALYALHTARNIAHTVGIFRRRLIFFHHVSGNRHDSTFIITVIFQCGQCLTLEPQLRLGHFVEQPEIQEYIEKATADTDRIVTIAVCFTKSHHAIAAALYFPESVYENCLQILVYQRLSGYIVHNIACPDTPRNGISRYRKMRPFGMIEDGFDQDLDNDAAARMVGYAYGHGEDPHFENYSEESYRMDEWQKKIRVSDRWSSQFFANSIDVKLRSVGSSREEDGSEIARKLEEGMTYLKRVEHNRWCVEKLMTGFRPINGEEEKVIRSMPENERKSKNDEWKKWPTMAHLDLRSYEGVEDIDPVTVQRDNDSRLIRAIPYIVARK